jgi:hypothetical protein
MSFIGQVRILKDGSVELGFAQNGKTVFKKGPFEAEAKAAAQRVIDRQIQNLRRDLQKGETYCKHFVAIAEACSRPIVVGRELRVGDLVEGVPGEDLLAGFVLSFYVGSDNLPFCVVHSYNHEKCDYPTHILQHIRAESLPKLAQRARASKKS